MKRPRDEPPRGVDARGAVSRILHPLTADEHGEYDRISREVRLRKAKLIRISAGSLVDPHKGVGPKTLAMAIVVFKKFCDGTGEPLLATDPEQIAHWDRQTISPSRRTILISRNGKIVPSRSYSDMVLRGVTAAAKAERRAAQSSNTSARMKGHAQFNSKEGCAIRLVLEIFGKLCPKKAARWKFRPVFDGMIADVMARHKSWPRGQWIAIQFKSASIRFGVHTSYDLSAKMYPEWVFCIGVGLLEYVPSATPSGPNDPDSDARVYEIWNVGRSASLHPTPGTLFKGIEPDRRIFVSHTPYGVEDSEAYVKAGLQRLLADMKAWPPENRRTREEIQYFLSPPGAKMKKIESAGIRAVAEAVKTHGYTVRPPWRQNETVDSLMRLKTQSGFTVTHVSHKTATIGHGDQDQRKFMLNVAKFDEFCDIVIASYAGEHTRVALMHRDAVYGRGKKYFCWNELDGAATLAAKGVRVFDLTVDAETRAFCLAVEAAGLER